MIRYKHLCFSSNVSFLWVGLPWLWEGSAPPSVHSMAWISTADAGKACFKPKKSVVPPESPAPGHWRLNWPRFAPASNVASNADLRARNKWKHHSFETCVFGFYLSIDLFARNFNWLSIASDCISQIKLWNYWIVFDGWCRFTHHTSLLLLWLFFAAVFTAFYSVRLIFQSELKFHHTVSFTMIMSVF